MPSLFDPLQLRGLTVKNRIVVAPMQQYMSIDGYATDWHLVHLGSRAVGGAGLIISENAAVHPIGRATYADLGFWKDEHIEKWRQINTFIRLQGAKSALQIGHFGSKSSRQHPDLGFAYMLPREGGWPTVSSSAVAPSPEAPLPRPLLIPEIAEIQEHFVQAAQRAVLAGFDAIEIHAAHGYLFHQFLSRVINQREDAYGGSLENRARFLLETIRAIRSKIPEAMPLLVKISASDFIDGNPLAWTMDDSLQLAPLLKAAGVDLITASGGGFTRVEKSKVFPSYQVPFAEKIKSATGIHTGAIGLITTAKQAETIIQKEQADLIMLAREHLRNPYFSIQAARELGQEADIPKPYKRGFM